MDNLKQASSLCEMIFLVLKQIEVWKLVWVGNFLSFSNLKCRWFVVNLQNNKSMTQGTLIITMALTCSSLLLYDVVPVWIIHLAATVNITPVNADTQTQHSLSEYNHVIIIYCTSLLLDTAAPWNVGARNEVITHDNNVEFSFNLNSLAQINLFLFYHT